MKQDNQGESKERDEKGVEATESAASSEERLGDSRKSDGPDRRAVVKAAIAATALRHYAWLAVPVAATRSSMPNCRAPSIAAPLIDELCGTSDGDGGHYMDLLCNTTAATKEGYDHDDDCSKGTGETGVVWTDDSCGSTDNSTGYLEKDEACGQNTQVGVLADGDCGEVGSATGHHKDNDCNAFGDADSDCNSSIAIGAVHADHACGGRGGVVVTDGDCGNGSNPYGQPHTDTDCSKVPSGGYASSDNDCSATVAPDEDCSLSGNSSGVHQDDGCTAKGSDDDCGLRNLGGGLHEDGP